MPLLTFVLETIIVKCTLQMATSTITVYTAVAIIYHITHRTWTTEQLQWEDRGHVLHRPTTLAYLRSAGTDRFAHPEPDCEESAHGSCTAGRCVRGSDWHVPRLLVQCMDQTACELL